MGEPKLIDRYEVIRALGEGAMGKVYLAQDPKLQRTVAVKVLREHVENVEMRERFRLEVRAVAALKHPNIVELYDYSGENARELYFVMEYVPGQSLYELTRIHGVMSEVTALCVGHELALALAHAHAQHIVHRDIKPENVLLYQGRLVLTDFGIVKAVDEANPIGVRGVSSRTRVLGTPGFMAPEQFAGRKIDPRTDIFALGAVLYNLTTGHVPYEGGSVEALYRNLKKGVCTDPRSHGRSLSPEFCNIIAGCIAPKVRDRFNDATQLKDGIRRALTRHGVPDIRDELRAYEQNPKEHRAAGGTPADMDVLMQELKVSLAQKDSTAARALAARLDAPPRQTRPWGPRRSGFPAGFISGLLSGVLMASVVWHWLVGR